MKSSLIEQLTLYKYRYQIGYGLLILIPAIMLFAQLGSLTPTVGPLEAQSALKNLDIGSIADNPVNGPYRLMQYASIQAFGPTPWAARLPSVIFGLVLLVSLFALLKLWHSERIAILGTLLVASSSWFLSYARLGTPAITLAAMLVLLLLATARFHHDEATGGRSFVLLVLIVALAAYTPLMSYFVILALVFHYQLLRQHLGKISLQHWLLGGLALVIALAPLGRAMWLSPGIIRELMGWPLGSLSIIDLFVNTTEAFGSVFWRAQPFAQIHLGNLAMLDIFTASMTALGLYHYERHYDHHRTQLLVVGAVTMLLGIGLSGNMSSLIVLLPFAYIFAATGIITLLAQWYTIFPQNPIARSVALIPMTLLLVVVGIYHTDRYFIAWARSPETKRAYTVDPLLLKRSVDSLKANNDKLLIVTNENIDQIQFLLSDTAPQLTFEVPHSGSNTRYRSYDYIFVAPTTHMVGIIKKQLNASPQIIASPSATQPVAYYRFDLK